MMVDQAKLGQQSVTGNLAADPELFTTRDGTELVGFRVLENQRVFDRQQQQWVDGETVGYDVAIRNKRLQEHAMAHISKGDRVTVHGDYHVSPYLNRNTAEPGLNHRIAARDVSVSVFDNRFVPTRELTTEPERNHGPEVEAELPNRAPLQGPGTSPPPGPPQQTASVDFGRPTTAQQREVAERQERAEQSWAAAALQQQEQMQQPQAGFGGPSM